MLGLPEELLYLRLIQLLRYIPPLPGGKRQFVDLCHERRELALESKRGKYHIKFLQFHSRQMTNRSLGTNYMLKGSVMAIHPKPVGKEIWI